MRTYSYLIIASLSLAVGWTLKGWEVDANESRVLRAEAKARTTKARDNFRLDLLAWQSYAAVLAANLNDVNNAYAGALRLYVRPDPLLTPDPSACMGDGTSGTNDKSRPARIAIHPEDAGRIIEGASRGDEAAIKHKVLVDYILTNCHPLK